MSEETEGEKKEVGRDDQDVQDSFSPVLLPPKTTASQGLSLNRSQYGGCSTKYNTPAGTQVVYRRFEGEQVVFPESSHQRTLARAVA